MCNILPYGMERSSHGDGESLIQKAKEQDVERSVRKDDEFCQATGVNRAFNEIPRDVVVPCDTSRLNVQVAGQYNNTDEDLSIINPDAYAGYVRRAKEIEEKQQQMLIEEYQVALHKSKENFVNSILVLSVDGLELLT